MVVAREGPPPLRVALISLGCPKNLVDSEIILGRLGAEGFVLTPSAEDADVIVVNTCGFVEAAREESIETILEACQLKAASTAPKRVVVAGCLGQRYGRELQREIPEIDAIVGLGQYHEIARALRQVAAARSRGHYWVSDPTTACQAEVGRVRLTPPHYAYIKISEGCDNPCTFCAIPAIRGRFRSKPLPAILDEARELAASGARELVLISQDTTSYGLDLDGTFALPRLLEGLSAVDGTEWIRVLYAYPAFLTPEMVSALASLDKVVKYLDMPLQHISDRMLRRMGRRLDEARTRALLDRLREEVPGICLRTTFLVGFPGETEEDHRALCRFVEEFRFERLGVFTYSREEGTPSASFPGQVPPEVMEARREELMLRQQEVAFRHNAERRGREVEVVIDELASGELPGDGKPLGGAGAGQRRLPRAVARSAGEAPEIDPVILVLDPDGEAREEEGLTASAGAEGTPRSARRPAAPARTPRGARGRPGSAAFPGARRRTVAAPPVSLAPGARVRVRITGSRDYDLLAELLPPPPR